MMVRREHGDEEERSAELAVLVVHSEMALVARMAFMRMRMRTIPLRCCAQPREAQQRVALTTEESADS